MANWNSGYVFNARGEHGGFFWNGASYVLLLRLNEVLRVSDEITQNLARLVLLDKMKFVEEELINTALFRQRERIRMEDKATYAVLFELTDHFGITDDFSTLLVLAALSDKMTIVDQARMLGAMLETDDVLAMSDDATVEAFVESIDEFGFADLAEMIRAIIRTNDQIGVTDGDPKHAISDFILGVTDEYDSAYDWLLPFGLKIDWDTTSIQVMPEASVTSIEMPGIDGSIVEDTVYKDRLFSIVGFSEQGLTVAQKEELKSKITEILDSTKYTTKKLTVQSSDTSFDVKYEGIANIVEGPSYVKATIPLRTSAYGYRTFESEVKGSGLINNEGDTPNGPKISIKGPITNPTFTLGDITYTWNGTVPQEQTLVIDHAMMTCYLQDAFGVKKNALRSLSGEFQKIPAHTSVVLAAEGDTEAQIVTTWHDRVLW